MLEHFGENFDPSECKETCDNCCSDKIHMEDKDNSSSSTIEIIDKKEEQEWDNNEVRNKSRK